MERYKSIGVAAGALMLPWAYLDQHSNIRNKEISIFINLEGVLRNLTLQKNLPDLIASYKKKVVLDLEAAILNMVASYRSYFLKEKCIPHIFLYHTSLKCQNQHMKSYAKYYRNYYKNKYCQNPEFVRMGELFQSTIVPEVKLILNYIKNCYLIESNTFDGSLIPLIITNVTKREAVLISTDIFDTLYAFQELFTMIYVKRRYSNLKVYSSVEGYVQSIIRDENPFELSIFNTELYYRLLLAVKGSKIRNIPSIKGFGYGKFLKVIKAGLENGIILKDFESLDSIIELFPSKYQDDLKSAFPCMSLETQYALLTETDIDNIMMQIVDQIDIESLEKLNTERFIEFPINIPGLI